MKRSSLFPALALLVVAAAPALGQTTPPEHPPATVGPESGRNAQIYVLESLGRHGPSHFPRVRHPEVEYEAGETLTFDRYHTVDVMYTWLERWAEWYPDIVELYQVGTSLEGRPILQVTLSIGTVTWEPQQYPAVDMAQLARQMESVGSKALESARARGGNSVAVGRLSTLIV